jgi:pyruvate/2-oxoglutarate dehydrogenase complex dihydrolipoamide acyltransferase (E2) component
MRPGDLAGLHAVAEPRLSCRRTVEGKAVEEPLLVNWEVNARLGDVLTRGLRPFPLRECDSIQVSQEVRLPDASSAPIALEIVPSDPAIESVFMACGERPAAPSPPATTATPAPEAPAPSPAPAEPAWQEARVLSTGGRTNVRMGPALDARIVVRLTPGTRVRVREANGDWWRAQQAAGAAFEGWIHKDRLSFE